VTDGTGERPGSEEMERLAHRRRRRAVRGLLYLAVVVVVLVFVVQNSQPVRVHFWVVDRHPRLIWVVLACLVLGTVFGYVLGGPERKATRLARRQEKHDRRARRHGGDEPRTDGR
jgi:uncharacterized integral membrane protein